MFSPGLPISLLFPKTYKSQLFAVLAPQWWYKLSINIRTAETIHIFCHKLKTHQMHVFPLHFYSYIVSNFSSAYLIKFMYLQFLGCIHLVECTFLQAISDKSISLINVMIDINMTHRKIYNNISGWVEKVAYYSGVYSEDGRQDSDLL